MKKNPIFNRTVEVIRARPKSKDQDRKIVVDITQTLTTVGMTTITTVTIKEEK